jgi:hypothetical protein
MEILIAINLFFLTFLMLALVSMLKSFQKGQQEIVKFVGETHGLSLTGFSTISSQISEVLKQTKVSTEWEKEFHRLLLNDFAKFPKTTIYGFLLQTIGTPSQQRLDLVAADTFEEAQNISQQLLLKEGQNPNFWNVIAHTKLEIPKIKNTEARNIVERIEKEMTFDRPIYAYINVLKLAMDRFVSNKTERSAIEKIIKRIEDKYANGNNNS